ncbi:hypothetical protein Tco_1229147 [Tanacetum coccineum]
MLKDQNGSLQVDLPRYEDKAALLREKLFMVVKKGKERDQVEQFLIESNTPYYDRGEGYAGDVKDEAGKLASQLQRMIAATDEVAIPTDVTEPIEKSKEEVSANVVNPNKAYKAIKSLEDALSVSEQCVTQLIEEKRKVIKTNTEEELRKAMDETHVSQFSNIVLRYRCARTELITPDLTCPSTRQLLWNSDGDSGPDLSFDKSASLERLFSLARVSLAEASKPDLSFGWVHFSQLGPLGLNKVITFEVLCRSLQIELTHWKSGFFFIDRWVILDAMVWRHSDASIDDPRPSASSFNMADVHHLSAHVINIRDMPEGVLVLYRLSHVWKSRVCDPVLRGADRNVMDIYDFLCLPEWTGVEVQEEPHFDVRSTFQRLPFYCTPLAAADAVIPDPTLEDLAVGTPSSKILAKAGASQKRKASTSGATSGHDGSSAAPAAEGSNTRDSHGKGIMVDDAAAPSGGASRLRPSSGPAPLFKDVSGNAIHTDFFPFSAGPYYATYPEGGVAGNCEFTREE